MNIYAIVEIAGKQYRVTPGQTIEVDKLSAVEGEIIEIDKVLLASDGGKTAIGKPYIDGAKVMATSKGEERGDKVIVYKFKAKVRFRRKVGHRQLFTRLVINKIEAPGLEKVEAGSGT